MAAIFALSAQPDLGTGLGTIDLVARKLAHMAEYGLLWLLWVRALGASMLVPATLITLGYAASDEWHQTMVDGRVGPRSTCSSTRRAWRSRGRRGGTGRCCPPVRRLR